MAQYLMAAKDDLLDEKQFIDEEASLRLAFLIFKS